MKNVSSSNTNVNNSPKTPGGISKSLLTPCRRVGLSRNWRKNGPSPFISPLASTGNNIILQERETKETRKRKERLLNETPETSSATLDSDDDINITGTNTDPKSVDIPRRKKTKSVVLDNIQEDNRSLETANETEIDTTNVTTPLRNVDVLKRSNSKILLSTINIPEEEIPPYSQDMDSVSNSDNENLTPSRNVVLSDGAQIKDFKAVIVSYGHQEDIALSSDNINTKFLEDSHYRNISENIQIVSTPVRTKSKSKTSLHTSHRESNLNLINKSIETDKNTIQQNSKEISNDIKEKSPNDLKKECVVVIQRKLFKNVENINTNKPQCSKITANESPSIQIVDSDEDIPLINLQSSTISNLDEDDDFIHDKNSIINKAVRLKTTKSPHSKLKATRLPKSQRNIVTNDIPTTTNIDDDDDFDSKKTILVRKTYTKVSKPAKAKSTGSITQRDIENLKNRIEAKKKLLLAQSLTPDTEELRNLIKKWQKGCQDALIELLDLMKNKFPDKERMDYSEMLKTLKIPPSLVGYDSDNDCFHRVDDASIILGQLKDL